MNDEIIKTQNEILECENRKKSLQDILLKQYYDYLETQGIKKGDIVDVKFYDKIDTGIFSFLYINFDRAKPKIHKITKNGNAHRTATVYCYEVKNISKHQPAQKQIKG